MYANDEATLEAAAAGEDLSEDTALQAALVRNVSLPAAVAYMIFILLYFPCIATFVAVKNETGKWGWAIGLSVYTIAVAWIVAFIGFRITTLFLSCFSLLP
jgi:ferrous iron transport protein B